MGKEAWYGMVLCAGGISIMWPMKVLYGVSDVKIVTNNFILTQLEQNSDMTHLWEVPENFWLKTCFNFFFFHILIQVSKFSTAIRSLEITTCFCKYYICYVSSPPSSPHLHLPIFLCPRLPPLQAPHSVHLFLPHPSHQPCSFILPTELQPGEMSLVACRAFCITEYHSPF